MGAQTGQGEAGSGMAAAMAVGAARYADVLDALAEAGVAAVFTQTGGMSAALEVALESGHHLLITDAEDVLPWDRTQQVGWGVGCYRPASEYDDGPLVFEAADNNTSIATLLDLVGEVLRSPVLRRPAGG